MEFYIILWTVFLGLSFPGIFGYAKPPYKSMLVVIFILAIFVAFRVDVGNDWESYKNYYYTGYAEDKTSGKMELGFSLVRNICYFSGFSHALFFYVLSCMSMFAIYKAATLFGVRNVYIAFFVYIALFFCSLQFNIVRNGLVASFVWLAFAYKARNFNTKAWIWIVVASSFHLVGVIFIPFLLFIDKVWRKKIVIVTISIAVVLFIVRFGERLMSLFPFLAVIDRLEGAMDSDRTDSYGLSLGMMFNIGIFAYCYFFRYKEYENDSVHRVLTNAMLLSVVIGLTLNAFNIIVARIGQPLNMALMFIWPAILYGIKRRNVKMLVGLCLTLYLGLYFYKPLVEDQKNDRAAMLVPYSMDLGQLFDTHL